MSSSNTRLIPNNAVTWSGAAPNCTMTITPAGSQSGTATITVTITDANSGSNNDTFDLTVSTPNSAPVLDNSGSMTLTDIDEDLAEASNSGRTVQQIIDRSAANSSNAVTDASAIGLQVKPGDPLVFICPQFDVITEIANQSFLGDIGLLPGPGGNPTAHQQAA